MTESLKAPAGTPKHVGSASRIEVVAPDGIGEITRDTDLAEVLLRSLVAADFHLASGDIVAITSKVVSKAEGRSRSGDRSEALVEETRRVVARRLMPTGSWVSIVRNRLGLTMAAAGIDASNVEQGSFLLLPEDPDRTARLLRQRLAYLADVNVGVIITDTAGRAWREGQTDLAIGAAGVLPAQTFAGQTDSYGNELAVTMPAVIDELASTAELAQSKLGGRPMAVIRGRSDVVLPPGVDGAGASSLIRAEGTDLFGYGAREAVLQALRADPGARAPFGAPVAAEEFALAAEQLGARVLAVADGRVELGCSGPTERLTTLGFAFGWQLELAQQGLPHPPGTSSTLVMRPIR